MRVGSIAPTREAIERARRVLARAILRNEAFDAMPIFERLEEELAALDRRESMMGRLRAAAAGLPA